MKETQIQLQILKWAKLKGYTCGKTKTHGVYNKGKYLFDPYIFLGFPDLCLFTNDKMYFIEVKKPQGKQSLYQKSFQELCQKTGINYILAYSLEDVVSSVK